MLCIVTSACTIPSIGTECPVREMHVVSGVRISPKSHSYMQVTPIPNIPNHLQSLGVQRSMCSVGPSLSMGIINIVVGVNWRTGFNI